MNNVPDIKVNPIQISVGVLVASYILGEFVMPKYHLAYFFNLFGVLGLISSVTLFILGFTLFNKRENINKIIKYSHCLEGRENLYILSINNIEI